MKSALIGWISDSAAVADAELRKLAREPAELVSRAVQPILWLVIFGHAFSQVRGMPIGDMRYLDYLAPGILAQSILFSSVFYGIAVVWERDLGIVHKLLVTPARRSALVLGKAMAAGCRGLVQAAMVYAVAIALHVDIRWELLPMLAVGAGVLFGSCLFATFSLVIACIVKTRERFMGVGQLLTMPLFFTSNAIYPLEVMPGWLRAVAQVNPLTYLVDALRGTMVVGGISTYAYGTSLGVTVVTFGLLLALAAHLYPGLAR
ncbi:ABC transporter permease [Hydrocarboniphaga effusa]|jgi:ABC-2 type transport system permease protein|uniref:ABC transporter permease n=1 Tax=Hydrocarboniphaga effusa TaxID=243629 RepID=UPI003137BC4F